MSVGGKKLFGIFNIIDAVIIIFVVLAAAMAVGSGIIGDKTPGDKNGEIEYVVYISGLRDVSRDAIKEGMGLVDGESGAAIGTITGVVEGPSTEILKLADARVVEATVPDRYAVTITVKCTGSVNEKGYYANGTQIAPNGDLKLVSTGVATSGVVMSVKEV